MTHRNEFLHPIGSSSAPSIKAFSVSEVNAVISDVLTANLPNVLSVEGEISNLSVAGSGHRYFSLKDASSTISCALFRGAANRISRDVLNGLKNGDKIVAKASLSVYQPRGSYQLIVSDIELAGFGALAKAFAELKQKLDYAGYTAAERKRPIPLWANTIAVVTSETGAAVRDVLTTLSRRAPFIPIKVYHTLVQGESSPDQIVRALERANNDEAASVILLVRGGGSLEDLQAFNDECVAMAVVKSRLPIVSGVGHETDFTIVDFVSDARAPTPTAAAEWASPDNEDLLKNLCSCQSRLQNELSRALVKKQESLLSLSKRLAIQSPKNILQQQSQRLDELALRLHRVVANKVDKHCSQLSFIERQITVNSPLQKLDRSFRHLQLLQARLYQSMQVHLHHNELLLGELDERLSRFTSFLHQRQQQLKGIHARLKLLSPTGVIGRGYALVFDEKGQLIKSTNNVQNDAFIKVCMVDGEFIAQVKLDE